MSICGFHFLEEFDFAWLMREICVVLHELGEVFTRSLILLFTRAESKQVLGNHG